MGLNRPTLEGHAPEEAEAQCQQLGRESVRVSIRPIGLYGGFRPPFPFLGVASPTPPPKKKKNRHQTGLPLFAGVTGQLGMGLGKLGQVVLVD